MLAPNDHQKVTKAQEDDIAQVTETIKQIFRNADPKQSGQIERGQLCQAFLDMGDGWSKDDLDDILNVLDKGDGQISYVEFVDWLMVEEDPQHRKNMWQETSVLLADEGPARDPDDKDDGINPDALLEEDNTEAEKQLAEIGVILHEIIEKDVWLMVSAQMGIDGDEGKDIFVRIQEEFKEKGLDYKAKGFPFREFLEELKVELDDIEGVMSVWQAISVARESIRLGVKPPDSKQAVLTMFDKIARALDTSNAPTKDAWNLINEGKVQFSKAERKALKEWEDKREKLIEQVQIYQAEPPLVNSSAGQTVCNQRCIAEVQAIIDECNAKGSKFTDPKWNHHGKMKTEMLYVDKKAPGYDCTVAPPALFKRLSDIVKDVGQKRGTSEALGLLFGGFAKAAPKTKADKKPVLFKGSIKPGDIVQGRIGTCFLLGAMGAIAGHNSQAVERMFIKYDVNVGVYGIRFNVDGEWSYVIVDDWMPVDENGDLMYARCKDPEEVWCPLLEKAYCKLHTCYEMCDGGQPSEAIFTFFGGVSGQFAIKRKHRRNPALFFQLLKQARDKGWLLTTGFAPHWNQSASTGKCGEAVLPTGLVSGHAYSVLRLVEVHGEQLVCCRNPWGSGEWTGKWSDANNFGEWTPEMVKATGFAQEEDGKFWMSIQDFVANSSGVDYARTFGPNWKKVTHYKHFQKTKLVCTAKSAYTAEEKGRVSFEQGDQIEVISMNGLWWKGHVLRNDGEGMFPADMVQVNDRPVARCDLVGTPAKDHSGEERPMTAVVMLMQRTAAFERRFEKRKEDGLNYKDLNYPTLELIIVGPDGSIAMKKQGHKRCVWGELKLPGGGVWKIYAVSLEGKGFPFAVRVYVKDGTCVLKDVAGANMADLQNIL